MTSKIEAAANETDFAFPILTADGVIFQLVDDKPAVLLIKRAFEPFLNVWALPGGYISKDETSLKALNRVLVEKTGISSRECSIIGQPFAFDSPGRDPRGYAITIMYIGLGRGLVPGADPGMTNGQAPTFWSLDKLPELAYDHAEIIAHAQAQLRALALHTNVLAALLPPSFTLSRLQTVYESLFGKPFDKRNFRKKILALDIVELTGDMVHEGAHRPAQAYRFKQAVSQNSPQRFM